VYRCNYLIAQQVYAVIVSHPVKGDLSPATISYTGGFYHIPIVGISSREAAFSDKVYQLIMNDLNQSNIISKLFPYLYY
jgi:hypothetical protein